MHDNSKKSTSKKFIYSACSKNTYSMITCRILANDAHQSQITYVTWHFEGYKKEIGLRIYEAVFEAIYICMYTGELTIDRQHIFMWPEPLLLHVLILLAYMFGQLPFPIDRIVSV
jgi:hypothetical protein